MPLDNKALAILKAAGGGSGGSGGLGGADWNASEGEPGHVLNRTHYKETVEIVNETQEMIEDGLFIFSVDYSFVIGETYHVTYNGVDYTCVAFDCGDGVGCIGNKAFIELEDTGEPFIMLNEGGLTCQDFNGETEITVKISCWQYTKIPGCYLPKLTIELPSDNTNVNLSYDTTELYDALKNGTPVYLRRAGDPWEREIAVTEWYTSVSLEHQKLMGREVSNLMVRLSAYSAENDRRYIVAINQTD